MEKYTRVQVEILLTADEKALLDHYVKENNQRYRKRGATRNLSLIHISEPTRPY